MFKYFKLFVFFSFFYKFCFSSQIPCCKIMLHCYPKIKNLKESNKGVDYEGVTICLNKKEYSYSDFIKELDKEIVKDEDFCKSCDVKNYSDLISKYKYFFGYTYNNENVKDNFYFPEDNFFEIDLRDKKKLILFYSFQIDCVYDYKFYDLKLKDEVLDKFSEECGVDKSEIYDTFREEVSVLNKFLNKEKLYITNNAIQKLLKISDGAKIMTYPYFNIKYRLYFDLYPSTSINARALTETCAATNGGENGFAFRVDVLKPIQITINLLNDELDDFPYKKINTIYKINDENSISMYDAITKSIEEKLYLEGKKPEDIKILSVNNEKIEIDLGGKADLGKYKNKIVPEQITIDILGNYDIIDDKNDKNIHNCGVTQNIKTQRKSCCSCC